MNLFKRLYLSILGSVRGENAFPNSKYVIEYAFTSGGVKYYTMNDVFNLPYQRGLEAIHAYEELTMKCDVEYLRKHNELVHEILNGNKITMVEWNRLNQINDQLRQRLDWVVLPDHLYRLASVVFFDLSEKPETYEIGYAREKIERWKRADDIDAFFLRQPVLKLIPFLADFEGSFATYSQVVNVINEKHLSNLSLKFGAIAESEATGKR
jgi:hypothetical protein